MQAGNQIVSVQIGELPEARRHPRYKLYIDIRVYPRNEAVVRGHTVDISQSGISDMLTMEVPVGEIVHLEFSLSTGDVEVLATVRQHTAFRYGFQFLEAGSAQDLNGQTCRQLALEQSVASDAPPSSTRSPH